MEFLQNIIAFVAIEKSNMSVQNLSYFKNIFLML